MNLLYIAHQGLDDGEHEYSFLLETKDFSAPFFENVQFDKGTADITLYKRGTNIEIHGDLECHLSTLCDRCNEPLNLPISLHETMRFKEGDPSGSTDELAFVKPNADKIELNDLFYEWIVVHLPIKREHPLDENEQFTCPFDVDKVLEGMQEEKTEIDSRWLKLQEIKDNYGTSEKKNIQDKKR